MHRPPRKTSKPTAGEGAAPRVIAITAEPIELCQLLKFSGLAESGGQAKQLIADGKVTLNGRVETQKRKKVMAGDTVTFAGESLVVKVGPATS